METPKQTFPKRAHALAKAAEDLAAVLEVVRAEAAEMAAAHERFESKRKKD